MAVGVRVVVGAVVDRRRFAPLFVRKMSARIVAKMCGTFGDDSCGNISAVGKPAS